ncbi:MAG TPA: bifunctional oligoribonuclease/PAP phosphatase NrnA [Thermoleophilaceae bacterium]|jgi:phosphoesterase RecJ-like protein|nr:bifunctional oligoribonuclease/PAP phosphatase NrnA [Thermoleophilaceae bacterium]
MGVVTDLDQVVVELRQAEKLLLTTHENPDGDALGSLLATHQILKLLGKDALMFMAADEFPLPHEYRQMDFNGVLNDPPEDVSERTVVFLDCGNIDRMPVDFLQQDNLHILNIDHHHDNTRFGTVNLVVPNASCTAEIVFRIAKELGVEITPEIGEALYVALVTDTGRFMYENTTPEAHRMAAELIELGVDVHRVYRRLYEDLPFGRLQLLARALSQVRRYDGGALTATYLTREDYEETGTVETDSEGVVDHIRAVQGTAVAALVRDLLSEDRAGVRKVSLRSTDGRVDVSKIARGFGGGGHRQAAGFSTELSVDELLERVRVEVREQL